MAEVKDRKFIRNSVLCKMYSPNLHKEYSEKQNVKGKTKTKGNEKET